MDVMKNMHMPVTHVCVDCENMPEAVEQMCRTQVLTSCQPYTLVWDRLCKRTCLATVRMKCEWAPKVCRKSPECEAVCRGFFDHVCPPAIPRVELALTDETMVDPCPFISKKPEDIPLDDPSRFSMNPNYIPNYPHY